MTSVLVDSNILLDLFTEDGRWYDWSANALAEAGEAAHLIINPIVYAEISVRFSDIESLDEVLLRADIGREPLAYEAAFLAGKVYRDYRRRGGQKRSPLPDFYVGAHAAVAGYRLLTRDAKRYRSYFPRLAIIAPG
ncbi:MAG: type II toxin-antitoxin system VapC family toxin [bacterium]|nr:type II toxin-antitoxin system VapC family toxin [bacterium]